MIRVLTAAVTAAALVAASPALACMPPPPNASYETQMARAAFVGRVVSIERSDPAGCLEDARARAKDRMSGDPGEAACEAFGYATLEPAWIIKGEDLVTGPFRVFWNRVGFCTVGWEPRMGDLAVAMIPEDPRRLGEGTTAVVDGIQQGEILFQIIMELVEEIQPRPSQ
ncbi:hypothetical protein [Brevundimonas aurifodinae]|uniref:Uncharacterized protein n=2 Tax=Brevundimonas TaxID=41275 RepID=A0ABV1NSJ9_9CAUL|nr:MAG: hypothetical protein B7Z42_07905 [Brevundimonas sp. 12-68-7]OYX33839.1 MAG: hypothetical protein B7Z01_07575 [Brevundimonas subvibrioides]